MNLSLEGPHYDMYLGAASQSAVSPFINQNNPLLSSKLNEVLKAVPGDTIPDQCKALQDL